jgi:transcriptional regulator with XRE-family HTH domain
VSVAQQFGDNLRRCRRRTGLSQEETAVRASLHRTAVGQLERGERVARVDTLIKLAGSLDASPAELLAGLAWEAGGTRRGNFRSTQAATAGSENGFNGTSHAGSSDRGRE